MLLCYFGYSQNIQINELVASNSEYIDEDGDTPDWIELYNTSTTSINMAGWSLSDNLLDPSMWMFPAYVLPGDSYALLWASDKNRIEIKYPHRLITQGDSWKYINPDNAVSDEWKSLDFDDSSWNEGISGIGYGDGDDATQISSSISLFARKKFNIEEVNSIKELILHIDYDDGFVAHLNGEEIARANITAESPNYTNFATEPREAIMYDGEVPERYEIEDFESLLVDGENILAVQIHNNIATSSDMSFIPFLSSLETLESSDKPETILSMRENLFHTNFKLSTNGETVYLFDENQELVDSLGYSELTSNISIGMTANNEIAYFQNTTPGNQNSDPSEGILKSEIIFSAVGGPCYACSSFPLTLSGNPQDTEIRYTLDMTIPDAQSSLYTDPIPIEKTEVVRAKIFKENYISSPVQSQSYLFDANHSLPVVSLITDPKNFFDQDSGIYELGDDYENNLPFFGANFWEDWERDIHFGIYETDRINRYSFDGGTKIFGGWSRANDQKSLSIFARKEYGSSAIDYPLFESRPFNSYQSVVLRNSGNDFLSSNLRDGTLTSLLDYMRLETAAYKPTVTYLNGEYWGIMNLREKINEHFIASRYNLDVDDIDIVELDAEATHGSADEYIELRDLISNINLTSTQNYNLIKEQIDIQNFILYNLIQIYIDNTDWPGNNIKFWKATGGKWRWILFDTDFAFGRWNPNNFNSNTLNFALEANGPNWPNPPWSTIVFRKMITNQEFRHQFINQFADEMNTTLLPSKVVELINTNANKISNEVADHYNRWDEGFGVWSTAVANMRNFANRRPEFVKQHILDRFNLPAYHRLRIQNDQLSNGYVIVNSLTIDEEELWSGDYFENVPIKLTAISRLGYRFSHWEGSINSTDPEQIINMGELMTMIPIFEEDPFEGTPVVINEINYNSNESFDTDDWVELHNHTDNIIDLSGWKLRDNDDSHEYIFPTGSIFQPKDFLVVSKDLSKFESIIPSIDNLFGNIGFGFSQDEDMVRLYDSDNILIDSVAYTSDDPWYMAANGEGPTLELLHPSLDNTLPENWGILHDYGSPSVSNLDASSIESVTSNHKIEIFPNPLADKISVKLESDHTIGNISIALYTVQGTLIQVLDNDVINKFEFYKEYELPSLLAGAYILEIKKNGVNYSRLLSKM